MTVNPKSILRYSFIIVIIPLIAFLLIAAAISLKWRMAIDSPLMMYAAFLMDKFGYLPYRDMIDPNMLGTYFIYFLIGHFSNYTDLGFRIFDLIYLAGICLVTWALFARINKRAALIGAVMYGLNYFQIGCDLSLQREVLLILPIIAAILVTEPSFKPGLKQNIRFLSAGILFGIAFLIKPHALIFFPVLIILRIVFKSEEVPRKPVIKMLYSLLGLAIPLTVGFFYLAYHHILGDFWDTAVNYWPRYAKISGDSNTIYGIDRIKYMISGFFSFGGFKAEFIPAVMGTFISLRLSVLTKEQKRLVLIFVAMAVTASIYPVFSNKFWLYHYWIFGYFIIMLGSLCLVEVRIKSENKKILAALALMTLFVWINIPPVGDVLNNAALKTDRFVRYFDTVDKVSSYLESHAVKGDKVQPLDWVGGAMHAMLIAKVPIATSIFYDADMYHHMSDKYTLYLRKRFMSELTATKPRFIIHTIKNRGWVSGRDTTRRFDELERYIKDYYTPKVKDDAFIIYERNS